VDSDALVATLGKKFDDKAVQAVVRELKIKSVPKAKPKEPDDYLEAKGDGIQLAFTDNDYLQGRDVPRYGNADMIVTRAFLYAADGEPGYKTFRGTLPGGGHVTDSFEQVVATLGPPTQVNENAGVVNTRNWKTDHYLMTFKYDRQGNVRYVQLILPAYLDRVKRQ
jgi:hypothetical protein